MTTILIDGGYFVGRLEKHWFYNPKRKNMKYWWEQRKAQKITKVERDNHLKRLFSYDLGYLHKIIQEIGFMSEVIVCYDGIYGRRPRGALYPAYKKNRRGNAEAHEHKGIDVRKRINKLKHNPNELLPDWKAEYDDYKEADDLIGEYCIHSKPDEDIIVMSKDKDLFQLMTLPNVRVHDFTNFMTSNRLLDECGVKPEQYLEFKALSGDRSDNIPGVNGIGPKKAAKYLSKYGSIGDFPENILTDEEYKLVSLWKRITQLPFHQH